MLNSINNNKDQVLNEIKKVRLGEGKLSYADSLKTEPTVVVKPKTSRK